MFKKANAWFDSLKSPNPRKIFDRQTVVVVVGLLGWYPLFVCSLILLRLPSPALNLFAYFVLVASQVWMIVVNVFALQRLWLLLRKK